MLHSPPKKPTFWQCVTIYIYIHIHTYIFLTFTFTHEHTFTFMNIYDLYAYWAVRRSPVPMIWRLRRHSRCTRGDPGWDGRGDVQEKRRYHQQKQHHIWWDYRWFSINWIEMVIYWRCWFITTDHKRMNGNSLHNGQWQSADIAKGLIWSQRAASGSQRTPEEPFCWV